MSVRWEAVALDRVRKGAVQHAMARRGIEWGDCRHTAATKSLAGAIQDEGDDAIPISTLIDFAVVPGMPDDWGLKPPMLVPGTDKDTRAERRAALREWQGQLSGRLIRMDLRAEGILRGTVKDGHFPDEVGRSLVAGRRNLLRSIRQLISSGFTPDHVRPGDPTLDAATQVWRAIEVGVPAMTQVRDDLWMDDAAIQAMGPEADSARKRLLSALACALGFDPQGHTLLHHGFHFYTPVQWALFRTLRDLCNVDQLFIVHDDGQTPVFESWRRFFDPSLDMPLVAHEAHGASVEAPAVALRSALSGRQVDTSSLSGRLDVHVSRNVAELARLMGTLRVEAETNGRDRPEVYAPAAEDIERSIRRLTGLADTHQAALGHLPVGTFLLCLYRCIGRDGQATIVGEDFLDMAATGLLGADAPTFGDTRRLAAYRRALPFFEDCRSPDQWRARTAALVDLVGPHVAAAGGRQDSPDLTRIESAVHNPLLRVPWLDISDGDARSLQNSVERVIDLVDSITAVGRRRLRDHLALVEKYLKTGMATASEEERARLESQVRGLKTGLDEEVDIEALVDVVNLLLGREMESDLVGDVADRSTSVGDVLFLDARGYTPKARDIHVTNLSDGAFPRRAPSLGWPFRLDALDPMGGLGHAVDIFQTRVETGTASDLYLLWLALDGVEAPARLHLSYVERLKGQPQNPSPAISLLSRPTSLTDAVADHVSGVVIRHGTANDDGLLDPARCRPLPEVARPVSDVMAARARLGDIDHRAVASASACPRRLAIQWLFGDSAAFNARHHHAMLHGNVRAALVTAGTYDGGAATDVANQAWAHLTPGQRRSSREKKVVKDSDVDGYGAHWTWLLTLGGKGSGADPDPVSKAYQLAKRDVAAGEVDELADQIVDDEARLLPDGLGALVADGDLSQEDAEKACTACPVNSRCQVRVVEGT